jgi:hypothetical protein
VSRGMDEVARVQYVDDGESLRMMLDVENVN